MMTSGCRVIQASRAREYEVRMPELPLGGGAPALLQAVGKRRALLVCSPTVGRLYAEQLYRALSHENANTQFLVLDSTEANKTVEQVLTVCHAAQEAGLDRRAVLVAVGGGVVLDIVTMAASWIRRGIEHIRVPTTLIGQVDAGVGIKGAANLGPKKNYIGVFHPPSAVLVDPSFLGTLPVQHVRHGLAEIIKIALVRDSALFDLVECHASEFISGPLSEHVVVRELVWRSIVGMLEELEPNLFEDQTYERLVDFGHTFSPALEAASHYTLHHGAAVAIDIALSATIAAEAGLLPHPVRERIIGVLARVGLPAWSPLLTPERCEAALSDAARHRGGCINLVVPTGIGHADFLRRNSDITPSLLKRALEVLAQAGRIPVPSPHSMRTAWPQTRQPQL